MEYLTDRILFSKNPTCSRPAQYYSILLPEQLPPISFGQLHRENLLEIAVDLDRIKHTDQRFFLSAFEGYIHLSPIGYCRTTLDLSRKSRFHIPGQSRRCPGKIILQLPAFSYLDLYLRHPVIVREDLIYRKEQTGTKITQYKTE